MVTVAVRNGNLRDAVTQLKRKLDKDGIHTEIKFRLLGKREREKWKRRKAARRRNRQIFGRARSQR